MEQEVYAHTEYGNGDRMLALHGDNIRYTVALGFFVWNGKYWKRDNGVEVTGLAIDTVRHMYKEAACLLKRAREENDDKRRQELSLKAEELNRWTRRSETIKMATSMVEYIKSQRGILVDVSMFDTHKDLVNFSNGTLDTRSFVFREHKREDYLTVCLSRAYRPELAKDTPTYTKFFSDIFLGNVDTMRMMQKALGMSLTGDTSDKCWFMLIGNGDNGKSTLMSLIQDLLEEYAYTLEPESISVSSYVPSGSAPRHDIASLRGKRFVVCSEIEEGMTLAENLLKRMTGNDRQSAREPYARAGFEFYYTHKLFVYTNEDFIIRSNSDSSYKRIYRVPFNMNLHKDQLDTELPKKLLMESEGILASIVEGCKLWRKEGMERSQEVKEATDKYRDEQDWLGEIIRNLYVVQSGTYTKCSDMLKVVNAYRQEELGMRTISAFTLKRAMEKRTNPKFPKDFERGVGNCYFGLSIKGKSTPKPPQPHTNGTVLTVDPFEDVDIEELAK